MTAMPVCSWSLQGAAGSDLGTSQYWVPIRIFAAVHGSATDQQLSHGCIQFSHIWYAYRSQNYSNVS